MRAPRIGAIGSGIVLLTLLTSCGSSEKVAPTTGATSEADPGRLVVTAKVDRLAVFHLPGDASPERTLASPNADGAPLVMLTAGQQPGWYRVLLPTPPNGSEGFVRAADVTVKRVTYRLDVHTKSHRLALFHGDRRVLSAKIAVGKDDAPTPRGEYYLTELLKVPDPTGPYGPYAYGLSGQSTTLKSFNGHAPVLGLHGTNDPSALGHDVSHGCVRVSNAVITKLAGLLPAGTPVMISAD